MNLIINSSSMQPIYDQIVAQIKGKIIKGEIKEEEALPSVRTLAKELKISALTVKKSYDVLEEEGLIVTVHGKGSFVASISQESIREEQKKEVKLELERTIRKARNCEISDSDIVELFREIIGY